MKKWIAIVLAMVFLLGILQPPVFAGQISNVTAQIDSLKQVTVKGTISSGAGQVVTIKITDPNGLLEYANSVVSYGSGNFEASYTMANNTAGRYDVFVNGFNASPASASFNYGTDNTLKGLAISRGNFDQAFAPEIKEYTVTVDKRVDSIAVTPTVNDSTAGVTVNDIATVSGKPSEPLQMDTGTNIIKVSVTSLAGQTNTYIITVTKEPDLLAGMTATASIDAHKNVTVSGTINSGAGQMVTMKIMDPSGSPEFAGSTVSTAEGRFQFSYQLSNPVNGRYTASLGGLGVSVPVTAYFDYFEMTSLVVSGIKLNPAFQNEITSYTAVAEDSVGSVTITPTSSDSKAKITVNSVSVANGTAFGPMILQTGENTVSVVLSGQDGISSKTYTIIIDKTMGTVADGTVEAAIDADKVVSVSGTIGSDENRQVTIMVKDPNDNVDYLATTETTAGGDFQFTYPLINETKGQYNVFVGARYLSSPLSASFLYDYHTPALSRLELSDGRLSPAFASDETEYSATVAYETKKVEVSPYAVDPQATIKVNGTTVKSGESSGSISLNEGQNTIRIVVTAPNGQEETYTIEVTRELAPPKSSSNNADLSGLAVSDGSLEPDFSAAVTSYTVNVGNTVSDIRVTPTTADTSAGVSVNGKVLRSGSTSDAVNLDVGQNTVLVKVTAENGSEKTYTLTVIREGSANADLSGIILSSGSINGFAPEKMDYAAEVQNSVTEIQVTPSVADATAAIKVNGSDVSSGETSDPIPLTAGNNTIAIVVTAQNGNIKTYTVTVKRAYNVNLSTLNLSKPDHGIIPLTPAFAGDSAQSYNASVADIVASINVTPAAIEPTAVIRVNNTVVSSGEMRAVSLNVGENTITVTVTAPDNTSRTYTVTVSRAASNNAYLSGLSVSAGSLNFPFNYEITSYEVQVGNNVSQINVTPITWDENATVAVNGQAVISGSASNAINLGVGINYVYVKVTAQNGFELIYTLIVTRKGSSNADLSSLTVSSGTLSPDFAAAITDYAVTVPNNVTSITVSMHKDDATATLIVNDEYGYDNNIPYTKNLDVGSNLINIVVKAQDGVTTKKYTLTVTRGYSANADLKGISLSSGTITGFDPAVMAYTVNVPNNVSSIRVTPDKADSTATLKINGSDTLGIVTPIDLLPGDNTISIVVTAQDGFSSKTYTITVKRAFNVNLSAIQLKSEAVPGGIALSPAFAADLLNYTARVDNGVSSITVTPFKAAAETAVIKVNADVVASGSASPPISLNVGANPITVTVTAPDETAKTYTITVTRSILYTAELSSLAFSEGSLSPVFNPPDINYTIEVSSHTESITVTPIPLDPDATMTVKLGNTEISGNDGIYTLENLAFGTNWIIITVTAQDGKTTKTYNIKLERLYSYDATLSALTVSGGGVLSPSFDPAVTDYTVNVGNEVTSVTVTPTVNDSYASVQVEGADVVSGSASQSIDLVVGTGKKITIRVKPQIGAYKYYYVTVTRAKSGNANLSALDVSPGSLNEIFAANVTAYTMNVANTVTNLTVTPTAADNTATVAVNGGTSLAVGNNTITVTVTAQNGTSKVYQITVTREPSANADLSGITLSTGSLNEVFAANVTAYTMNVANTVTSLTVTPTAADNTATVAVNGGTSLAVGSNTITITVTAQNGTTVKTYTITVTRAKSGNANLNSLLLKNGEAILTPTPTFAPGTVAYGLEVANVVDSMTVTPTVEDDTATVTVNGSEVTSGSASSDISLAVGRNTITVVVTAQDNTARTYTITVNRLSNNANLSGLLLKNGDTVLTLTPVFASGTSIYYLNVVNTVTSLTLTPTAEDDTAAVTVQRNGTEAADISGVYTMSLDIGTTTIKVIVKAQDDTINEYTITVTRPPSNNADLSALGVRGSRQLNEVFDPDTQDYTLTVASSATNITVEATTWQENATIRFPNGDPWTHEGEAHIALNESGDTVITILVTAQDTTTTKTYTITVTRNSAVSDASLSALSFVLHGEGGSQESWLTPAGEGKEGYNGFDPEHLSYALGVDNWEELTVTPTAHSEEYIQRINVTFLDADGNEMAGSGEVASGSATNHISTQVLKKVEIEVTAGDGTTQTYTVTLNTGFLSGLSVCAGSETLDISPAFAASTLNYGVSVDNSVEEIIISATTGDAGATITINGGDSPCYTGIEVGSTVFTITVTASQGFFGPDIVRTYTLTVTREELFTDKALAPLNSMELELSPAPDQDEAVTEEAAEIQPDQDIAETDPPVTVDTGRGDEADVEMDVIPDTTPEAGGQLAEEMPNHDDGRVNHPSTEPGDTVPENETPSEDTVPAASEMEPDQPDQDAVNSELDTPALPEP